MNGNFSAFTFINNKTVQELSAITFQGQKPSYKVSSVVFYLLGDLRGTRL